MTKDEWIFCTLVEFIEERGWSRMEEGSGWWWKLGAEEGTIGECVEWELDEAGIDTRREPVRA